MTESLKAKWIDYWTERISEFDYTELDKFMKDNQISDDEYDELCGIKLVVVERE